MTYFSQYSARPTEIEVGQYYFREKQFPPADTFIAKGLEVRELAFGKNHPCIADTLMTLGAVRRELGRYKDAEENIMRALTIRRSHYELDSHYVMAAISSLGGVLLKGKNFDRAEALWIKYKAQLEEKLRYDEMNVATTTAYTNEHEAHNFHEQHAPAMMDYNTRRTKKPKQKKSGKIKRKKHPLVRDAKRQIRIAKRERDRYIMWWEDKRERKLDEYRGFKVEDLRNTPEELQRVALLKTLRDPEGFDIFRMYATKSESQFRVDFWLRVEKFRQIDPEENPKRFAAEIVEITELFVAPAMILPSISTAQRDRVLDAQIVGSDKSISLDMFDEVRKVVTDQLAFGTFARFASHPIGVAYLRKRFIKPPIVLVDKYEKQLKKPKQYNSLSAAVDGVDTSNIYGNSSDSSSDDSDDDLLSTEEEFEEKK